jgi:hypothetical protein
MCERDNEKVEPMREIEETRDEARAGGGVSDVETAGETTAADVVGGDTTDRRPVGADTLARVDEKTKREDGAEN